MSTPPDPPSPPAHQAAAVTAAGAGVEQRREMDARPPFLTWRAIHALVLGALAAQITAYAVLTALYRP